MLLTNSPLYAITTNIIFILILWGIGYPLVKWLNKGCKDNFFPDFLIAPVIGMNLFATGFFLISCTGLFRYISPSFMVIPLLFYAVIVIILSNQLKNLKFGMIKWPYIIFLLLGIIFLGATLSPPLGWDEMVYHQSIVQRWIIDGFPKIYYDLPYSGFPSSNSFIFWFLSDTGGIIAPKLFIWVCWMLNSFIFYNLLIKNGLGKVISSVLVIAFSFNPVMLMVMADAYVEMIMLLNLTTVLYMFSPVYDQTSRQLDNRIYYKLALVFAILAAGQTTVKLTGIVLLLIPFLLILFHVPNEISVKQRIRVSLFMGICWILLILPFYLRPFLITGNPFYPYFSEFFSESISTTSMSQFHHAIGSARYGSRSISMFFSAPIALIFSQKTFEGTLGLQFAVIFIIFIWALIFKRERTNQLFCFIICTLYVFWFFTAQQARFIIPVVFLIYFTTGLQIKNFKRIYLKVAGSILLLLTLVSLPFSSSGYYYYSWMQLMGRIRFIDYFYTGTGDHYLKAIDALSNMTPRDCKVMLLFEHRLLYLPRKCRIGTPYFQEKFFTPADKITEKEVMKTLKNNDFDYLLIAVNPTSALKKNQKKSIKTATNL